MDSISQKMRECSLQDKGSLHGDASLKFDMHTDFLLHFLIGLFFGSNSYQKKA